MAVALLEEWCKMVSADDRKSLMVIGIPVNCGEPEIQAVLQEALKCVGSYQLLGKIFRKQDNTSAVLLELLEDRDMSVVPNEVQANGVVWKVIFKTPNQDTKFLQKLNLFLEKEGQPVFFKGMAPEKVNHIPVDSHTSKNIWAAQSDG